jgi:hypothetical protein
LSLTLPSSMLTSFPFSCWNGRHVYPTRHGLLVVSYEGSSCTSPAHTIFLFYV